MRSIVSRLGVALSLLAMSSYANALSPAKESHLVDLDFRHNSTAITYERSKLDTVVCHARNMSLEVIILVGHADETEATTQSLSQQRAENVKRLLVLLGLPANQIYLEGKGANQPISDGEPGRNRAVQLEMVGSPSAASKSDCVPVWEKLFVNLETTKAMVVATAQVNDGLVAPYIPAAIAIANKRMDLLDRLLTGPSKIALEADERVILMRTAILTGDSQFVERLISFGIRAKEFRRTSLPIIWSVCDSDPLRVPETENVKMVETLLAWGATANGVSKDYGKERSALGCAAKRNQLILADLLLANGANKNSPIAEPPIVSAARFPEMVRKLVEANSDLRAKTRQGTTLLHEYRFDSPQDVEWLVQRGADINARDNNGSTPIHYAARYASQAVLKAFIAQGAVLDPVREKTIFHDFKFTNPEEVKWLTGLGLDINSRTEIGLTPLHMAVTYAPPSVLEAFVDNGASLDHGVPLLVDRAVRNLLGLRWLIDKGVPLEGNQGIVHSVCRQGDAAVPVIESLRRRGISLRETDKSGVTPLQLAIGALAPNLVKRLVEFGAVDRPVEAKAAREFAERQQIRRFLVCHGCSESYIKQRTKLLNADEVLEERQRNKDMIVNILRSAEHGS